MGVRHWITRGRHFVIFVSIWHHLRSKQHTQLNYHRIKTSLTESFHWLLSASSVCHPGNVVWEDVCDGGNEAPTTPQPLCIQCVLYDVITYWGQIYLPAPLLGVMFKALMKMASFTPLSNCLDSVVRTSVLSNSTVIPPVGGLVSIPGIATEHIILTVGP